MCISYYYFIIITLYTRLVISRSSVFRWTIHAHARARAHTRIYTSVYVIISGNRVHVTGLDGGESSTAFTRTNSTQNSNNNIVQFHRRNIRQTWLIRNTRNLYSPIPDECNAAISYNIFRFRNHVIFPSVLLDFGRPRSIYVCLSIHP